LHLRYQRVLLTVYNYEFAMELKSIVQS
jgi:hypothetical protein